MVTTNFQKDWIPWPSWLRHGANNAGISGSIPLGIIFLFCVISRIDITGSHSINLLLFCFSYERNILHSICLTSSIDIQFIFLPAPIFSSLTNRSQTQL